MRWQWKVFLPILAVLILSVVTIYAVLRSLDIHETQWILVAVVSFAILLCFVLPSVLLILIERPLEQIMEAIARVRQGDLSARVDFAKREDDIGQLGREFNGMLQRLDENRLEIDNNGLSVNLICSGCLVTAAQTGAIGLLLGALSQNVP
jgi:nitrogen fixation/metabolism regulation signal transduction histidine kinase